MPVRISRPMSLAEMIQAIAGGNIGALSACVSLVERTPVVDPEDLLGVFGPILDLDRLNIYGDDIWLLYKNVCGENVNVLLAVLRANQMGLGSATQDAIKLAISNCGEGLDLVQVMKDVRKALPNFDPNRP